MATGTAKRRPSAKGRKMSWEKYQEIDAVNFSSAKLMGISPLHYKTYRDGVKPPPTPAQIVGSAIHSAVFEPEEFLNRYARWGGKARRGKEYDAFVAEHQGRTVLSGTDYDMAVTIRDRVRSNPVAGPLLKKGVAERVVRWDYLTADGTIECKARLDWIGDGVVVDLKSCRAIDSRSFGKAVMAYQYHVQAAYYRYGHVMAAGLSAPFMFKFIAVEKTPPYDVAVYGVDDGVLSMGVSTWAEWLDKISRCEAHNDWPGQFMGEQSVVLPEWAYDLGEMEDVHDEG